MDDMPIRLIHNLAFVLLVQCATGDDDRWKPISEAENEQLVKQCKGKSIVSCKG